VQQDRQTFSFQKAKVIVIKLVPGFDDECISAIVTSNPFKAAKSFSIGNVWNRKWTFRKSRRYNLYIFDDR
jgi:hypothetical protein